MRLIPDKYRSQLFLALFMLACSSAMSQYKVNGRVFDMSAQTPLHSVTVLSSSGKGTITDSVGRYSIIASKQDSIWFSYLGKATPKYAVKDIPNILQFEVSLHVNVTELKKVQVMPPSYKRDSLQNREDYAKAFNFEKPGFGTSITPGGGVGLDINELIGMFQFRKNHRMLAFQERLVREEQEKFIDHRFSRALVIRLTGLKGKELDTFMLRYRPTLEFTAFSTDYEFQDFIKNSFQRYKNIRKAVFNNGFND